MLAKKVAKTTVQNLKTLVLVAHAQKIKIGEKLPERRNLMIQNMLSERGQICRIDGVGARKLRCRRMLARKKDIAKILNFVDSHVLDHDVTPPFCKFV